MVHIWHEDTQKSATTLFWTFLYKNNVSIKLNQVDIKGLSGNQQLLEYVKSSVINKQDTYIILMDNVFDNDRVLMYYEALLEYCSVFPNIHVVDLLCFEYLILKFKYFIEWTEPIKLNKAYMELKVIRDRFIQCVDSGKRWNRDTILENFVHNHFRIDKNDIDYEKKIAYISNEVVAALILTKMTYAGHGGFGISKTNFGSCWYCDCCPIFHAKVGDLKCKLYRYTKKSEEKARNLWNGTLAKQIVENALK